MRLAWLGGGVVLGASVLAGAGCSTTPSTPDDGDATRSTKQAIQGGTTDTTSTFAVGVCNGSGPVNSGNCFGICSGALILPNVVATARHCVDEAPSKIDCSLNGTFGARKTGSFRVTTNTTMGASASGWYGVQSIAIPDGDLLCGDDIALLVLNSSIPSNVAKPIVPGVQYQMWDPDQYVSAFYAIGYGKTSPTATSSSGTRRISKIISVLCVPGSPLPCPAGFSAKEFVGGDGICSGDSGSSAYESVNLGNGTPVSFGVLARGGENDEQTECVGSAYTRFDAHRDFVLQVAKAASNNWTLYPEPTWTAYKPPPVVKPKDAGADASKDASTTTKPSKLALGEVCETEGQCESGVCSDQGDGTLLCSQSCDPADSTSCPDGFECREELCLPATPPAAAPGATTTTTTSGCAAGGRSTASTAWMAGIAALALAAARRRRR